MDSTSVAGLASSVITLNVLSAAQQAGVNLASFIAGSLGSNIGRADAFQHLEQAVLTAETIGLLQTADNLSILVTASATPGIDLSLIQNTLASAGINASAASVAAAILGQITQISNEQIRQRVVVIGTGRYARDVFTA